MYYSDENMLMLSGIQHYMFCPRQWGLIHISQEWQDNRLTTEGQLLHRHVDDPFYRQKNKNAIALRSLQIASHTLGLYGIADVVELSPAESPHNAVRHPRYPGYWTVMPIEYKRGGKKTTKCDEVQLMAQAICLEEMYGIRIERGAMYYNEEKHREMICFDDNLRELTRSYAQGMHAAFASKQIPEPVYKPHCRNCSLYEICMPSIVKAPKASAYLKKYLYEETT